MQMKRAVMNIINNRAKYKKPEFWYNPTTPEWKSRYPH